MEIEEMNEPRGAVLKSYMEVKKNTKGFNYDSKIYADCTDEEIENMKKKTKEAQDWLNENYGGFNE